MPGWVSHHSYDTVPHNHCRFKRLRMVSILDHQRCAFSIWQCPLASEHVHLSPKECAAHPTAWRMHPEEWYSGASASTVTSSGASELQISELQYICVFPALCH